MRKGDVVQFEDSGKVITATYEGPVETITYHIVRLVDGSQRNVDERKFVKNPLTMWVGFDEELKHAESMVKAINIIMGEPPCSNTVPQPSSSEPDYSGGIHSPI